MWRYGNNLFLPTMTGVLLVLWAFVKWRVMDISDPMLQLDLQAE